MLFYLKQYIYFLLFQFKQSRRPRILAIRHLAEPTLFAATEAAPACRTTLGILTQDAVQSACLTPIATAGRLALTNAVSILALELADREPGVMSSTTSLAAPALKAPAEIHSSTADTMNQLVSNTDP
jgi:hypothetical protein